MSNAIGPDDIGYDDNFISVNSLLNDHQSGFRKNRSCTSAILKITEDIRQQTDNSYV